MIIDLPTSEFRARLEHLCEKDRSYFTITLPGQSMDSLIKPFYGQIRDDSFVLKRNSRYTPSSYQIAGSYSSKGERSTTVGYAKTFNRAYFYLVRLAAFIPAILTVLADGFKFGDILLFSIPTVAHLLDNYWGDRLEKTFLLEMQMIANYKVGFR